MPDERKEVIRRVQAALDTLADQLYTQHSYLMAQKLIRQPEFGRASAVGIFVGFGGEVETVRLMAAALRLGKRVAAPTVDVGQRRLLWREVEDPERDIDLGPLGIPQPHLTCREMQPALMDLVCVPAVAWDEKGRRVARWPGYFNRFLRLVPRAFKAGMAFELQVIDDLSKLTQETLVEALITEDRVRRFGHAQTPQEWRLPGGPKGYKG